MIVALAFATASLLAWIVLVFFRGRYWRARPMLDLPAKRDSSPSPLPSVSAVIPARNEAEVLADTLPSVLSQEYTSPFRVVVVDDRSEDETATVARTIGESLGSEHRLDIVAGAPLPAGWAGKVWAMSQGFEQACESAPEYVWFTDADIQHDPKTLAALVTQAVRKKLDLVSVMAKLRVDTWWDRLLIPAFVYFFAKLYPFSFVNNPKRRTAGAAGGCILVRREILQSAGGIEAIRSALIDDCTLAKLVKQSGGRIWLGFSRGVRSVRTYGSLRSTWDMVARSAFDQLGYSWLKLLGTGAGMLLLYLAPPVLTVAGFILGRPLGVELGALSGFTWALMTFSVLPILKHQSCPFWIAPLLPLAGTLYTAMTFSSAWRHVSGHTRVWRG